MKKAFSVIKKIFKIFGGFIAYLLGIAIIIALFAANTFGPRYTALVSNFLGHTTSKVEDVVDNEEDTEYFKSDFDSEETWKASGDELVREVEQEGIVLLRNEDKALPLASGNKVTLLGQNAVDFVYGGVGSGAVSSKGLATLKESMEKAGFEVNPTAWDFYQEGPGKDYRKALPSITGAGEFAVNEVPQSVYTDEVLASFENYKDVALVVIGRSGGESADIPTTELSTGFHYLEIDDNEKAMIEMAKKEFNKVVVLLNTSNPLELGFLEELDVDAAIWTGAVGQSGILAVGDVLSGVVNPSGRLVDTYAYDVHSAPAAANLGDYTITNSDVASGNKYLVYQEGIYIGYRYYETRYEDVVLGNETKANYDYSQTVQYPFGYGLSYTDFSYSQFSQTEQADSFEIKVTVKNDGDVAGKDVVQVYLQQPYTDYDKANSIEKSAVQLVGFKKTETIEPGASETVTISVPKEELKVYDSKGHGTYILEEGNYYFSVGQDAHQALNNILAKKEKTLADGMTQAGDASLVGVYEQKDLDTTTFAKSQKTNKDITNQFDDADITNYDASAKYLSRQNWTGTWPTAYQDGSWEATDAFVKDLEIQHTEDNSQEMPVMGTVDESVGKLDAIDLRGLDYNDPLWDTLLNQLTLEEMDNLIRNGGYATVPIESINLPATIVKDGPAGISSNLVGGKSATAYPTQIVMGSTWNTELIERVGISVGNDSLQVGVHGWYAPGVNLHRLAFGGRNFEYFSEDSFLSAAMNTSEVKGVQSKGMFVTMKHYALNDTETNRIGGSIFANEQSIRQLYLRPFEDAVREADASGVMTAMNRIGAKWAGAHSGLMTGTLKDEWGFEGIAITDQASFKNFAYADLRQGLEAGTNLWLNTDTSLWKLEEDEYTPAVVNQMREATHSVLYRIVNSNAMNGLGKGDKVVVVRPLWIYWLWAATAILGLVALLLFFFPTRGIVRAVKKWKANRKAKKAAQ